MPDLQQQREDYISVLHQSGLIDKGCKSCQPFIEWVRAHWVYEGTPEVPAPMMPHHMASPNCKSGGRPHCSCDTCF